MVVIKLQQEFLCELANILCWFRISVSVILGLATEPAAIFACLYSLALISDVLDGWCYRKFTKDKPCKKHWFNRLPLSMDPIADFCLVGGGIIHVMNDKPMGLFYVGLLALAMLGWNFLGNISPDKTYTFLMTLLTYFWFSMMIGMLLMVWMVNTGAYWVIGITVTLGIFYTIWAKIHVRSRNIRRRG